MSTCLTPSYSFRNTPTRKQGVGAYGFFFNKDAVKVIHSSGPRAKRALITTTAADKENDPNFYYQLDKLSDESSSSSPNSSLRPEEEKEIKKSNKPAVNRNLLRLQQMAPMTPAPVKKVPSRLNRRNTISIAMASPSLQQRQSVRVVERAETVSVYERARIKLHVANTPDCLPCRELQFSDIYNFIESNLKSSTGGCMYISGVPGTGKTLTVKHVISCLNELAKEKMLPAFKFIEVNAFQVTEPHQIYKLIYKELTDVNVSAEHAIMLLEKKFELKSIDPVVLLVDELDMLCTKKQDILYNLFDWPYKKNSKWIVITIANAMNLPEQVMINKVSSRLGLSRMTFQPYTHKELEEIVKLRLQELDVFENEAIIFAARKVAAVSGDARRALEICRRATEMAERELIMNNERDLNPTKKQKHSSASSFVYVNINHVDLAIHHMFSSAKINLLLNASVHEQFFMEAIATLYKKSGIEETTLNKIFEQHTLICNYNKTRPLNRTQLLNVCCSLGSSKLILLEPCNNIYLQRVRANMSIDDIDFVLKKIQDNIFL